nr:hypothetical protein [Tanacetum cinerariifolium]
PSIIIHSEPKSKDKGKGILVEEPKPLKKQAQIEQDEAYKEDNAVMRYQELKRKPQIKAQARKNMMIYLRNMAGFKIDYFKRMSYDYIRPIFEKYFNSNVAFIEKTKEQMEEEASSALKRASESQAEKAAKKQKLDEEIMPNDDDDVYTEATPLALKICKATIARRIQTRVVFGYILHKDQADLELMLLKTSKIYSKGLRLLVEDLLLLVQIDAAG